ncbi:transcription termination factor Rho [Ligilactobacillus sp. WC1T17]|uniref:Transcription termination factor Rho n=1 Tax=Ligilactobacillus ruminis TaxID=1623 RepID=A0ABY1ACN1_9LACO|nr:transcription termination factor Rho [Ligilactobacillus ruminis]
MGEQNFTLEALQKKTLKEIYEYARKYKIKYYSQMNKKELSLAVIRAQAEKNDFRMQGILEIFYDDGGYGFLRPINYSSSKEDIYLSASQIKKFGLRNGDEVAGRVRPPRSNASNERYGMMYIDAVNGKAPDEAKGRPHFPALTAIYPDQRLVLEHDSKELSTRLVDLFAPIGFGQRSLIVAPPKAGKTTFLKNIAAGISQNAKKAKLIMLLIDERPEEVTDLEDYLAKINPTGEVVYSTFDQRPENHVKISEMVLERAMRLVEDKQDVVILLDSLTRLARAYNLVVPSSGKILSGGLDPNALYKPKKFFGAARNVREGGSLTIIATALVDTGSRQDDIIFEEFKGTGNQELQLSRELAERRIFPAVDLKKSGTRKEDLLLSPAELEATWKLRELMDNDLRKSTGEILKMLRQTADNQEFCQNILATKVKKRVTLQKNRKR